MNNILTNLEKHLCRQKRSHQYLSTKTIQQNSDYEKYQINPCLSYFKRGASKSRKSFAEEIHHSLNQKQKFISPKFFYDETGSKLFDEICLLSEYYLTRTEIEILEKIKFTLTDYIDAHRLVELGSGSSIKTKLLLDAFAQIQDQIEYVPIDISDILRESSQKLQKEYDNLRITGIIDTYEEGLEFIKEFDKKPNLIVFLGSSFGNFSPEEGSNFLRTINSTIKESDFFLIGLDLVKEKSILENAYDDSKGITAQFNLNLLKRINQELDGNFNLENFAHVALYNDAEKRMEMYLHSLEKQSVKIPKANLSLSFEKDELIHTENSHKYSVTQIHELLENNGFNLNRIWQDENKHYALVLASKNNSKNLRHI